jgi:hypothetical protein
VSDRDLTARLRVTAILGLGRGTARIEPGRSLPVAVHAGALLEVVGWAAPPGRPLRVLMPWVTGGASAMAMLARRLAGEASKHALRWVTNPVEVTPSHVLRHGKDAWEIVGPSGAVERLGTDPGDAIAAIAKLPRGASLFVQFPATAAIDVGEGIDETGRAEQADYILTGRYANHRLEYAWVRPSTTSSDRRRSGLPLRTDWIAGAPAALRNAVLRLQRIHAWNLLESPSNDGSPYRLTLRRIRTGETAKGVLIGEEHYDVVLRNAAPIGPGVRQRYVYVFVIDSGGKSSLIFPRSGSVENRLPISLPAPPELSLGNDSAVEISPPFGVDTWFLLTTDEALPNPWILEWDGVRTRAPEEPTALERLLLLTGASSRTGLRVVTPTTWSIERVVFESVPQRQERGV